MLLWQYWILMFRNSHGITSHCKTCDKSSGILNRNWNGCFIYEWNKSGLYICSKKKKLLRTHHWPLRERPSHFCKLHGMDMLINKMWYAKMYGCYPVHYITALRWVVPLLWPKRCLNYHFDFNFKLLFWHIFGHNSTTPRRMKFLSKYFNSLTEFS